MAERRIINGYIVEKQADGSLVTIGPANGGGASMPADPTYQYEGPKAQADLTGSQLDNQYKQVQIQESTAGKLPTGYRRTPDGGAELIPGVPGPAKTPAQIAMEGDQRRGGVIRQFIADVRGLYEKDHKGGWPGSIAGNVPFRPANEEFNAAANGILPLIRPLVAQTAKEGDSDKEMQVFMAYIPQASDNDRTIERKLDMLETLIGGMMRGVTPSQMQADVSSGRQQVMPFAAQDAQGGGGEPPQASIINPAPGRAATRSETAALEPGQRFAYDEGGKPIGILDAQGNWISGYGEIVGGNQQERDDAARDTTLGEIDAFGRGLVDWPTLGNANKVSAALGAIPDALSGEGFSDAYWRNMDMENRKDAADERVNPYARLGGQLGGAIASGYGSARAFPNLFRGRIPAFSPKAMAADAATGATYFASKALDTGENPVTEAGNGSLLSMAGGIGGRAVANVGGRALSGVTNPDVQRLHRAGVPMTFPQMVGGSGLGLMSSGAKAGEVVKGFEDVLAGLGPLGAGVRAARTEGVDAMNKAAFREGGFNVRDIGEAGIGQAKAIRSQAYSDALDGRTVAADLPFVQGINDIARQSDNIRGMEGMFRDTLKTRVGSQFDKTSRSMSGRGMQAAVRGLRAEAKKANKSDQYMRSDQFADAAKAAERELLDLASRQNPGMAQAYLDANKLNMGLGVLKDAVRAGKNTEGRFTAAQLGAAADRAAEKFGGKGGTTSRPFYKLQRSAQRVLPSQMPDSGTAGRAATLSLPYVAAAGAQSGVVPGVETGSPSANLLTAIALLSSPAGRKLSEKALLSRPAVVRATGKNIRKRAGLFGSASAPLPILISE